MAAGRVSPSSARSSSQPQVLPTRSERPIHYATLAEGLAAVERIGLKIVYPVDQLVLSRLWQTKALPDPLPTWSQWQDTVKREAHKLVAYLEGFKLFAGAHAIEERQFAQVTYHRRRDASGEWVLDDIRVVQSDKLEDLISNQLSEHEGCLWLRRRETSIFYDVVGQQGDGVEELKLWSPPPRPSAIFKAGRTQTPDAQALEDARRRLQKLLSGESFGQTETSRIDPLFTPADLQSIEPLVTLPVTLPVGVRGFAPTALSWKDLATPPTDTIPAQPVDLPEFVGGDTFLPEPSLKMVVASHGVLAGGMFLAAIATAVELPVGAAVGTMRGVQVVLNYGRPLLAY